MDFRQDCDLHRLHLALGLPTKWLKTESQAGGIPTILVGRRFMFSVAAVRATREQRTKLKDGGRS